MQRWCTCLVLFAAACGFARAADPAGRPPALAPRQHGRGPRPLRSTCRRTRRRVIAAIGLSRTWESEGEYDKAAAVVDDALEGVTRDPDLLARRAELLYLRGQLDDALKAADAAIAKQDDHFLARWVRGQGLPRPRRPEEGRRRVPLVRPHLHRPATGRQGDQGPRRPAARRPGRGRERPLAQPRRPVRVHPQRGLRRRPQGRQGLLAGRVPGRHAAAGEVQPRRGADGLRQGADDQPEGRRGARRQGPGGAAAVGDEGGRGASPSRR